LRFLRAFVFICVTLFFNPLHKLLRPIQKYQSLTALSKSPNSTSSYHRSSVVKRIFFGWRVVAAAFIVAMFSWGAGFYGPPVFLDALHRSRGWPVPLISAAISLHFLFGAAVVGQLATLHRRFGVKVITCAGGVLTTLGLLGWALAREPWQLFAITLLSGAGWAMTSGAALNAMISPWFNRRRPAALSMAFNGASMGGVVFSPLWVLLIGALGFPAAAALIGAVMTVTLWFLASRYLARRPADLELHPDGERACVAASVTPAHHDRLANPWRERRFTTLAIAAALGLFAQIGLISQLFSLLVPPLGEAGAGAAMALTTGGAIAGRTLLGTAIGPSADRRIAGAANVGLQACGSIVLILAGGQSIVLLIAGCLLFGLGLGNVTSLPPLIAQAEFMPADVPRVVALVTALSQATYAFAPAVFGILRNVGDGAGLAFGSAAVLFAAAALIQLSSGAIFMLGRRRHSL
jgi:hypothetical protein